MNEVAENRDSKTHYRAAELSERKWVECNWRRKTRSVSFACCDFGQSFYHAWEMCCFKLLQCYFAAWCLKLMNSWASFLLHVDSLVLENRLLNRREKLTINTAVTEMHLDSNAQENCSPFSDPVWSYFLFLSFCPVLVSCQLQAPFLHTDKVKAWMLSNACKFGVFRKVLKHQVASQSFDAT